MNNKITICEDRPAPTRSAYAGQVYMYTSATAVISYWLCVKERHTYYRFVNLRNGSYFSGGPRHSAPTNLTLVPIGTCLKFVIGA